VNRNEVADYLDFVRVRWWLSLFVWCLAGGGAAWWSYCLYTESWLWAAVCRHQPSSEWSCSWRRRSGVLPLFVGHAYKLSSYITMSTVHIIYHFT